MTIDGESLKLNSELRTEAREQLAGNWGNAVLTCLVYAVILGAASGVGGIGGIILGGPMELGLATFFLKLKREKSAQVEDLFQGFKKFESSLVLYIVRSIFVLLWSLLFIIPGIVAFFRYSMAIYILHDSPEMSGIEALNQSKELMDGNKGKLFGLYFSFIGWAILCLFTAGIGYIWLFPYIKASEANFYEDLKAAQRV